MRKIVTVMYEAEFDDVLYSDCSNDEILENFQNGVWSIGTLRFSPKIEVLLVQDVVESEKADADSTGEVDGTTEQHEVPC